MSRSLSFFRIHLILLCFLCLSISLSLSLSHSLFLSLSLWFPCSLSVVYFQLERSFIMWHRFLQVVSFLCFIFSFCTVCTGLGFWITNNDNNNNNNIIIINIISFVFVLFFVCFFFIKINLEIELSLIQRSFSPCTRLSTLSRRIVFIFFIWVFLFLMKAWWINNSIFTTGVEDEFHHVTPTSD